MPSAKKFPVLVAVLVCLAVLWGGAGAARAADNYITSGFALSIPGDVHKLISYDAAATIDAGPSALKTGENTIQLTFARDIEMAITPDRRGGAGVTGWGQLIWNFSVNGSEPASVFIDEATWSSTTRFTFRTIELTTSAPVPEESPTLSYSFYPNDPLKYLALAVPDEPALVSRFSIPIRTAARLADLSLATASVGGNPVRLMPDFAPETTEYGTNVPLEVENIYVSPVAEDGATYGIAFNGSTYNAPATLPLAPGLNAVTVTVSKPGLSDLTYTINITRAAEITRELKSVNVSYSDPGNKFDPSPSRTTNMFSGQFAYNLGILTSAADKIRVTPTLPDGSRVARITVAGNGVTQDVAGGGTVEIPLDMQSPTKQWNEFTVTLDNLVVYTFTVARQDATAVLTSLKLYRVSNATGAEEEIELDPTVTASLWAGENDGTYHYAVLKTKRALTAQDVENASFYVVPTANEGSTIYVGSSIYRGGTVCASGGKSQKFASTPGGGYLTFETWLTRPALTGNTEQQSGYVYQVWIGQPDYDLTLQGLAISDAVTGKYYLDPASFVSGQLEWNLEPDSGDFSEFVKIYAIGGNVGITTNFGATVTTLYDSLTGGLKKVISQPSWSMGKDKEEATFTITLTSPATRASKTYTIRCKRPVRRVRYVYVGMTPERLAQVVYPNIKLGSLGGWEYQLKTDGAYTYIIDAPYTVPHQPLDPKGTFEVPWAVYPPDPIDMDAFEFGRTQTMDVVAVKVNEARSGGTIVYKRHGGVLNIYEEGKVPATEIWAVDPVVRIGKKQLEAPDIVAEFRVVDPMTMSTKANTKDFELWPKSEFLPLMDIDFYFTELSLQPGQSVVVPLKPRIRTFAQYRSQLPQELLDKYPKVYVDGFAIPLTKNTALDYRTGPYSIRTAGESFIKYANIDPVDFSMGWEGDLPETEYIKIETTTDVWNCIPAVRVTALKAMPRKDQLIRVLAKTSILGEKAFFRVNVLPDDVDSRGQTEFSCLTLNPRTVIFGKDGKTGKWGYADKQFMSGGLSLVYFFTHVLVDLSANGAGAIIGVWLAPINIMLDFTIQFVNDLVVTDGDCRVVWRGLTVDKPVYNGGRYQGKNWAVAFDGNKTAYSSYIGAPGAQWILSNRSLNNYEGINQLFSLLGESHGTAFPAFALNLSKAKPEAAEEFIRKNKHLLPAMGGEINWKNIKQKFYGPYWIHAVGHTEAGRIELDNSVLFVGVVEGSDDDTGSSSAGAASSGISAADMRTIETSGPGKFRVVKRFQSSGGSAGADLPLKAGERRAAKRSGSGGVRAAEADDDEPWIVFNPYRYSATSTSYALADEDAEVKIAVTLDNDPSVAKARKAGNSVTPFRYVVPQIIGASNVTVWDADGNEIPSDHREMMYDDQEESAESKTARLRRASPSSPQSFVIGFTAPPGAVETVELLNFYYKRDGDDTLYCVNATTGNGSNGGFTMGEPVSKDAEPVESGSDDSGGGCNATGFLGGGMLVLTLAILLGMHKWRTRA